MNLDNLNPNPREIIAKGGTISIPTAVSVENDEFCSVEAAMLTDDLKCLTSIAVVDKAGFVIQLRHDKSLSNSEGYELEICPSGAEIKALSNVGIFYGIQTLLQLLLLSESGTLPLLRIRDWPRYKMRSFMVDMGRGLFSISYLERIIRILARLKMNTLHLHLCDDHLNGLKFNKLPLGSENPGAISLDELSYLITYARKYHITVIPEIECWGHASSYLYHYPDLYGAPGMWSGMSFGIGEELFELLEQVFDELVPVLEKDCHIHVGLDEAEWALLPSVTDKIKDEYSPVKLVERLYQIVQNAGEKYDRNITMHLWADHGGRPIPENICRRVVVHPWGYFESMKDNIHQKVARFSKENYRFMMGAGMSSKHFSGHFGATEIWSQAAADCDNVQGLTICMWETNNLANRMIGLYGGAHFAWNPKSLPKHENTPDYDPLHEAQYGYLMLAMRRWQALFKDADNDALLKDQGAEVYDGCFCWGDNAGQPVAPTVPFMARGANRKKLATE